MKSQPLGKSGLQTSLLSYGCMRITGTWNPAEITDQHKEKGKTALITAWESGYTLFDHADIYARGACESLHGELLAETPGFRDEILIATKCGIRWPGDSGPQAPHRYDFSKEHILWSCDQSLNRLQTDRIDLYQLHRPDVLMNPHEVAEAFTELKIKGKVLHFGVSNFSPSFVETLQSALPDPLLVNQVEVSLGHLDCFTDGTLDQCIRSQITPLSWSPVAGGWLASNKAPEDDHQFKVWQELGDQAKKYDTDRANIAYAWLLKHPSKIVPIVGTTYPERIKSAIQSTEIKYSREDWYRLYTAARGTNLP